MRTNLLEQFFSENSYGDLVSLTPTSRVAFSFSVGMLFGAIGFDPGIMAAAVAALLGGIAVWGSNRSTAKQASKELALAESGRSLLIGNMALCDVTPLRGFTIESQDDTTA
jgi:hypothetical protein